MTPEESVELLAARCAAVSATLEETRLETWAVPDLDDVRARAFVTTGIGAAESPARFLAHLLQRGGLSAAFVPLSRFATSAHIGGDTLIVFSQGLSPNACLALARHREARSTLLFTSVASGAGSSASARVDSLLSAGVHVRVLPPASEGEILLRVLGPSAATLAAIMLAEEILERAGASLSQRVGPDVAHAAKAAYEAPLLFEPTALTRRTSMIVPGDHTDLAHGLGWKLLEGLSVPLPPVWDVLSFAHGPFQEMRDHDETLLAMFDEHAGPFVSRLGEMLHPPGHLLVRMPHRLPGHLAFFEHDARLNAHVVAALRAQPRDLSSWPGMGEDAPLYGISSR